MSRKKCHAAVLYFAFAFLVPFSVEATTAQCNYADYNKSQKNIQRDSNSVFSIKVPKSWQVKKTKNNSYSEMIVHSSGNCIISLLISSRPLDNNERNIPTLRLLNTMIGYSISNLQREGHEVVNYGRHKEFKAGAPAFVIVSLDKKTSKMATSYISVIDDKHYSIVATSDGRQNGRGVATILKTLINSFKVL